MDLSGEGRKENNNKRKANCNTSSLPEPDGVDFLTPDSEYSTEITDEIQKEDIVSCTDSGVQFFNLPNMFKIIYTGELAKMGSENIDVVMGYGDNKQWENAETCTMNKTAFQTFELLTFRKNPGSINAAFRNESGVWDNNLGHNYVFYADDNLGKV